MIISETENQVKENKLFNDYEWYYSNFLANIQKATDEFFRKNISFRFMGISIDENILSYGDEYFVNKTDVNKLSSVIVKISSSLLSSILDNTLGASEKEFSLRRITGLEANLINAYTEFLYKNIEKCLNTDEINKKIIKSSKNYNFTFFAKYGNNHAGKIIIIIPEYMLTKVKGKKFSDVFGISDFSNTNINVNIGTGTTRVPLNDVKALEEGDIIVLENSDINKMAVLWNGETVPFSITPNPSLIISIDSNGENEMEEETSTNSQNMWDSILVDVVAEFDNVKLSLGDLKQISEGLVIDVGSVYDNKIKLRVENQVVAIGELVILNDRYGVRIEKVKKTKEETVQKKEAAKATPPAAATAAKKPAAKAAPPAGAKKPIPKAAASKPAQPEKGDENFDYSDFEIEDESI